MTSNNSRFQTLRLVASGWAAAVAIAFCLWTAPPALSAGATQPTDENEVTLGDIRVNYGKRYPFAADAANRDTVENGESTGAKKVNFKDNAYDSIKWKCQDDVDKGNPMGDDEHYHQDQKQGSANVPSARDEEAFQKGWIKCYGLPMSDTQFQIIDRENRQRMLELLFDPERWMWTETTKSHMQSTSMANSTGGAAESSFKGAFAAISQTLINVANEKSAVATDAKEKGQRSSRQAVFVVQQMYKTVFVPMALLLLLPGAVLTQVKGLVTRTMLGGREDASSPFEGMFRAIIAIFLIPATQMIVSYSIDVGNAMAEHVRDPAKGWVQESTLLQWAKEQTFNPPQDNVNNAILEQPASINNPSPSQQTQTGAGGGGDTTGSSGTAGGTQGSAKNGQFDIAKVFGVQSDNAAIKAINDFINFFLGGYTSDAPAGEDGGQGKSAGQLEGSVTNENQFWLSGAMQTGFNTAAQGMGYSITVLTAYQLVFICYLFLLGPIAAAFYAWPGGIGSLFKKVFSNWVDAVVVLCLWRFWWCVILACMTQRVIYLHPNPGSPSEMMVFNCFLALLLYIPFQPFNFNPGPIVSSVLDKAAAGGGGGGGGGAGGAQPSHHDLAGQAPAQSGNAQPSTSTTHTESQTAAQSEATTGGAEGGGSGAESGSAEEEGEREQAGGARPHSAAHPLIGAPPLKADSRDVNGSHGKEAPVPPPPTTAPESSAGNTQQEVANQVGGAFVEGIQAGTPPTVALGSRGAKVLVATSDSRHAARGAAAWQKVASRWAQGQAPQGQSPPSSVSASGSPAPSSVLPSGSSNPAPATSASEIASANPGPAGGNPQASPPGDARPAASHPPGSAPPLTGPRRDSNSS